MHYESWLDGGAYSSYGIASTYYTGALMTVTYRIPAYKFDGVRVYTNKPPCGPKRGHGTTQPRYGFEIQLDKIATDLGFDPLEYRRRILQPANSRTANDQRIPTMGLGDCLDALNAETSYRRSTARCRSARASASPGTRTSRAPACRSTGTSSPLRREREDRPRRRVTVSCGTGELARART